MGHAALLLKRSASSTPTDSHSLLPISDKHDAHNKPSKRHPPSTSPFPIRIILLFPLLVIILICFLYFHHPLSRNRKLQQPIPRPSMRRMSEQYDKVFLNGCQAPETNGPRANATFVVLAMNKDLDGVIQSVKSIERHFNRWFHYPYVFLNDGEFSPTFKDTVQKYTSSSIEFGNVDASMWDFPDWIEPSVAKKEIVRQGDAAVMYGGLESYHHMCRFYSGFFYKHPLLLKYKWYWRIEPEVKYFCDITYDPFVEMEKANKTYGFTIAVKELKETVPNLFRYASAYRRKQNIPSRGMWEMFTAQIEQDEALNTEKDPRHPKRQVEDNQAENTQQPMSTAAKFPTIDPDAMEGEVFNMCHFWSNFEIAKLDWFRSQEYESFFQNMDRSGGFWMERWGDAPIHSLAAGVLLAPNEVHYFRDIGYRHSTIQHCPGNAPGRQLDHIPYLEQTAKDKLVRELEDSYWAFPDKPIENGVGCRCKCDTDLVEVETKDGSCMAEWVHVTGGWESPQES